MNEPTIAYTLFALLLASSGSMLAGAVLGWCANAYHNRTLRQDFDSRLRDSQQEVAILRLRGADGGELKKLEKTNEQKDKLIKRFMQRYLDVKKENEASRLSLSKAEKQLKAQISTTDIWKQKCESLKNAYRARTETENRPVLKSSTSNTEKPDAKPANTNNNSVVSEAKKKGNIAPVKTTVSSTLNTNNAKVVPGISIQARLQAETIDILKRKNNGTAVEAPPTTEGKSVTGSPAKSRTEQPSADQSLSATVASKSRPTKKARIRKAVQKSDDLTQIKGIGPAIEKALNAEGIYCFDQLAVLKRTEVRKLDEALGRYGRIERLKWVSKARQLGKKSKQEAAVAA